MLDKTKWAPKPPPEPVITGSLTPGPKKRGRKSEKEKEKPLLKVEDKNIIMYFD